MPTYYEEFGEGLKDFLVERCVVQEPNVLEQAKHLEHVDMLRMLYGKHILPPELVEWFNICLDEPRHCMEGAAEVDLRVVRSYFLAALKRCPKLKKEGGVTVILI